MRRPILSNRERRAVRSARALLRGDAVFEAVLGLPLAIDASRGRLTLPAPATPVRVRMFGTALLPVAALLWLEADRPHATRLAYLSVANAVTGATLAAWMAASRRGLSAAAAVGVGGAAAVMGALAAAEAAVASNMPR